MFAWPQQFSFLGSRAFPRLITAFFGTDTTITARQEGFSVTVSSRRFGRRHADYLWSEVTETAYDEFLDRNACRVFTVHTARGLAFNVQDNVSGFDDLIALFNQMTPGLPYTWERQESPNVLTGRKEYVRTPRRPDG